jgi:hypothetical protein
MPVVPVCRTFLFRLDERWTEKGEKYDIWAHLISERIHIPGRDFFSGLPVQDLIQTGIRQFRVQTTGIESLRFISLNHYQFRV